MSVRRPSAKFPKSCCVWCGASPTAAGCGVFARRWRHSGTLSGTISQQTASKAVPSGDRRTTANAREAPVHLGPWSNCGKSSGRAHFWRLHVKISTFGANHSSRRSRVPSCTKTVPGKSFRLLVNTLEPQLVQKTRSSPRARTCLGIRTVGEALGVSAQHGEIRVRHRRECRHLSAGRPLAIRAVAVCDERRLGIEPVRHLTAGTVTRVLLAHVLSPSKKLWKFQIVEHLHAALG